MTIQAVIMRERMVLSMSVSLEGILSFSYRQGREKLETRHKKQRLVGAKGRPCLFQREIKGLPKPTRCSL